MSGYSDTVEHIRQEIGIYAGDIEDYKDQIDELQGEIAVKEDELWDLRSQLADLEAERAKNPILGESTEARFHALVERKDEHVDYSISRLASDLVRYGCDEGGCIIIMASGAVYAGASPYPSNDDEFSLVAFDEALKAEAETSGLGNLLEDK